MRKRRGSNKLKIIIQYNSHFQVRIIASAGILSYHLSEFQVFSIESNIIESRGALVGGETFIMRHLCICYTFIMHLLYIYYASIIYPLSVSIIHLLYI